LVSAILEFYKDALAESKQDSIRCPIIKNDAVRCELFKFFYEQKEFVLHDKADAFEALDKILTILHCWLVSSD